VVWFARMLNSKALGKVGGLAIALALGAACGGAPLVGSSAATGGAGGALDGGADGSAPDPTRTAGCDQFPTQITGRFVRYAISVPNVAPSYGPAYANRVYWVRLPKSYDPGRAYPVALLGPGCGASGDSAIPLEEASKDDAIIVGLNGVDNCFNHDAVDTPDLPYFDATLARVESEVCIDPSRIFVAGFSSGSWLASYLGCARADVIRAQASSAGGLPPIPACKGPIPAMFAADTADSKNSPATVKQAVDRVRAVNGCGEETEPYDFGVPSPCVQFKGCMPGYPVVSCVTSGLGHQDQSVTKISTVGFWHFWSSLPAR
jgi:poly(3-hydroxybutyrate) depolymerase